MSYFMNISAVSAYEKKSNGKKTVGLYGDIVDDGGEVVEGRQVIHLSLQGNALPITKEQLTRLGFKGSLEADLVGVKAPVAPTGDEDPTHDSWDLSLPPGVDPAVEDLLK